MNRDIEPPKEQPKRKSTLVRGADGRLRPAGDDDIGDVWEQQRRLKLQEEIEEQRREKQRKKLRKKRGLVGIIKNDVTRGWTYIRLQLFGEDAVDAKSLKTLQADSDTAPHKQKPLVPLVLAFSKRNYRKAANFTATNKKRVLPIAGALVVAVLVFVIWPRGGTQKQPADSTEQGISVRPKLEKGTPKFDTLLPITKSIKDLGGWTRVSPPTSAPVWAYVDSIDGVGITVSQQTMPPNISQQGGVSQLAANFGAGQPLDANGIEAYLGTSAEGPQSVIFGKQNLLILIKSNSIIPNDKWADYITSLQ